MHSVYPVEFARIETPASNQNAKTTGLGIWPVRNAGELFQRETDTQAVHKQSLQHPVRSGALHGSRGGRLYERVIEMLLLLRNH